jgi:hypothetical protein
MMPDPVVSMRSFVCALAWAVVAGGDGRGVAESPRGKSAHVDETEHRALELAAPDKIVVRDFLVPPEIGAADDVPGARRPERRARRKSEAVLEASPSVAQQIADGFATTLVSELSRTELPLVRVPSSDASAPAPTALIVGGRFIAVDGGNGGKRTILGFGRGASDVKTEVQLALATSTGVVLLWKLIVPGESGAAPAAVATTGRAPVVGPRDRAAVQADASRLAREVASRIMAEMVTQHWIAPPPPAL